MHEQLEDLLDNAFACIDGAESNKAAEKALRAQGFTRAPQVYQAASDHLQVGALHCVVRSICI